jgi:succinate dehydrogenase / fumarate reductase cytochrome b subunit
MAVSGAILAGYVAVHLVGNLQIYAGADRLNGYAYFLHHTPSLLWGVRALLLVSVLAHIANALALRLLRSRARPVRYRVWRSAGTPRSGRTMLWSGLAILAFIVYHLLHFTFGSVHPSFIEGDVYHNVVAGFRQVPAAITYIAAMVFLALHLMHGLFSMTQSAGLSHPLYSLRVKQIAYALAILIAAGNISIPVSVLAGWVR